MAMATGLPNPCRTCNHVGRGPHRHHRKGDVPVNQRYVRIMLWAFMLGLLAPRGWTLPLWLVAAAILAIMYMWGLYWLVQDRINVRRWRRHQQRTIPIGEVRIPRRTIQPPDDPTYLHLDRTDL